MNAVTPVNQSNATPVFDYSALPEDVANEARAAADQVRVYGATIKSSYIEIGRALIRIKSRLDHGLFLGWVRSEFGYSPRTAQHMMSVADLVPEAKSEIFSHLARTSLIALAAPSTPDSVREEVMTAVERGETFTPRQIKAKVDEVKDAQVPKSNGASDKAPANTYVEEPAESKPEAGQSPSAPNKVPDSAPVEADPAPTSSPETEVLIDISASLFQLAERWRESDLEDRAIEIADQIGAEAFGQGLVDTLRGKPVEYILRVPATVAGEAGDDAARPFPDRQTASIGA